MIRNDILIVSGARTPFGGFGGALKEFTATQLGVIAARAAVTKAASNLKGEVAFKLYDTYGFPLDLTQDVLRARQIGVDLAGFDKAMAEQKAKARAAWAGSGEAANEAIWFDLHEKVGATDFLG